MAQAMTLTINPTFCSCGNEENFNFYGNKEPSCYDGVYYVVGQQYQRDTLPHREKNVSQAPIQQEDNLDMGYSQGKASQQSTNPQLGIVRPLASTPSPSRLSDTLEQNNVTPEHLVRTTKSPPGPPPPPSNFQSPKKKEVFSPLNIADEISNWHKSGKKLRPTQSSAGERRSGSQGHSVDLGRTSRSKNTNNIAAVSPMASLLTEKEKLTEQRNKDVTEVQGSDNNQDPRDMVKAALMVRAPAVRGDESSSEEENTSEEEDDSDSE